MKNAILVYMVIFAFLFILSTSLMMTWMNGNQITLVVFYEHVILSFICFCLLMIFSTLFVFLLIGCGMFIFLICKSILKLEKTGG